MLSKPLLFAAIMRRFREGRTPEEGAREGLSNSLAIGATACP
jgi:hypothetical protein